MRSIFLALLLASGLTPSLTAQDAPVYSKPLGIGLEEVVYPYPVQFLELKSFEGEPLRMAFMDVNSGASRTVLLLHGKNFFGAYWENAIAVLSKAGFRVIVPDQIGFGKSTKPNTHYSFDWLAENTQKLLDHLGIRQVAVLGHSMGGMLAVRFARQFSDRTTHLILEDPIGLEDYRMKVPPTSFEKTLAKELGDTNTVNLRTFFRNYVVKWNPEVFERYVEVRARVALSGEYPRWANASAQTYAMIYQQPVRHEFQLLQCQTLLVIGQSDHTTIGRDQVSAEVARTLGQYPQLGKDAARDIPHSKLVEIPNVGHIPHLEVPDQFNQAVLEFLR
jgi:pimeloyl-ACP methyl ester carboxylesterase